VKPSSCSRDEKEDHVKCAAFVMAGLRRGALQGLREKFDMQRGTVLTPPFAKPCHNLSTPYQREMDEFLK